MLNAIFLTALVGSLFALLYWGIRTLPAERWQMLAAVPIVKVDGTSWSSPEFTAYMSEVNQLHSTHLGFVNPALYSIFQSSGYTDYTDVTSGTNGAYNAGTGFDLVTGIGAPKGWALANAL